MAQVLAASSSDILAQWQQRASLGKALYSKTEPPASYMTSGTSSFFGPALAWSDGTPPVANGYAGYVIDSDTIYISGVYNGQLGTTPSHRARVPNFQRYSISSTALQAACLDLEEAVYYRLYVSVANPATYIVEKQYAFYNHKNVLVHEYTINNNASLGAPFLFFNLPGVASPDIGFTQQQAPPNSNISLYFGSIKITEVDNGQVVSVAVATSSQNPSVLVPAHSVVTVTFITTLVTSLEQHNPLGGAQEAYGWAQANIDTLFSRHTKAWKAIWNSRIEISGNNQLAQVVTASMYYILSSVREDWPYSLSPGSLTSNSYNGHVFWDAETWMYPSVLALHSNISSKGMLEYRFLRTTGAAAKAKSYNKGYSGYMFPWESAYTGDEVTPTWADTGEYEQHITGDIAFAIRQNFYLTRDLNWLKSKAFDVIVGIADFWASRVWKNPSSGQYEINGVTPPDEYAVNVNNSVYTNVVAVISLEFALESAGLLGQTLPQAQLYKDIIANMKIPFDQTKQIHLEYDGYNGKQIKQADVVLLGFPLGWPMPAQVRENDLNYYAPLTDPNGPAMTDAMHVVNWLDIGNPSQALKYWPLSYANVKAPFNVWTETPTGGAINFITGAGGFLQAVTFGWPGFRIAKDRISFNPQLPPATTGLALNNINFAGKLVTVSYTATTATVTLNSGDPIVVYVNGTPNQVKKGVPVQFAVQPFYLQ